MPKKVEDWPGRIFRYSDELRKLELAKDDSFYDRAISDFNGWLTDRIPGTFASNSADVFKTFLYAYINKPDEKSKELLAEHHDLILMICRELRFVSESLRHLIMGKAIDPDGMDSAESYKFEGVKEQANSILDLADEFASVLRPDFAENEIEKIREEIALWRDAIYLFNK